MHNLTPVLYTPLNSSPPIHSTCYSIILTCYITQINWSRDCCYTHAPNQQQRYTIPSVAYLLNTKRHGQHWYSDDAVTKVRRPHPVSHCSHCIRTITWSKTHNSYSQTWNFNKLIRIYELRSARNYLWRHCMEFRGCHNKVMRWLTHNH